MKKYRQDIAQYKNDWFTDWFRKMLGQRRVSAEQVAKETGLGWRTVESYRTGERSPNLKTLMLIIDRMGYQIQITEK